MGGSGGEGYNQVEVGRVGWGRVVLGQDGEGFSGVGGIGWRQGRWHSSGGQCSTLVGGW